MMPGSRTFNARQPSQDTHAVLMIPIERRSRVPRAIATLPSARRGVITRELIWISGASAAALIAAALIYVVVLVLPLHAAQARARLDYQVAEIALKKSEPRQAETALLSAITEWPRYSDAYSKLGDLYYASVKPELAAASYQQLAQVAPHYKHIYCRLADTAAIVGENGLVRSDAERELKLDPRCVRALDSLAMLDIRDNTKRATEEAEKAYRIEPTNVRAIITYSQMFSLDQPDRAIALLQQAKKLMPGSSEIDYDLGYCYSRGSANPNAASLALQLLREGEVLAPGHAGIHRELCRTLMQQGQLPAAEEEGELATQSDPHDSKAFFVYTQALERLGKHREAAAAEAKFHLLNDAESRQRTITTRYGDHPTGGQQAHDLAADDVTLGKTREAVYILEAAIAANPRDGRLRRDLSRLIQSGASP